MYGSEDQSLMVTLGAEFNTSKASFVDSDVLPKKYDPKKTYSFSGKRVKRGLYRSQNGTTLNADANGAYNILRKSNPEFSFGQLVKKVGEGILDWLHPYTRLKIC
jgi:putative transposase